MIDRGRVAGLGSISVTKVAGVLDVLQDPGFDARVLDSYVWKLITTYDKRQYRVVFNRKEGSRIPGRWQIVAFYDDPVRKTRVLRLVKTWQDENKDYLPLSQAMYDWLVRTDMRNAFGTDNPAEQVRRLEDMENRVKEKEQEKSLSDLNYFNVWNRNQWAKVKAEAERDYRFLTVSRTGSWR